MQASNAAKGKTPSLKTTHQDMARSVIDKHGLPALIYMNTGWVSQWHKQQGQNNQNPFNPNKDSIPCVVDLPVLCAGYLHLSFPNYSEAWLLMQTQFVNI